MVVRLLHTEQGVSSILTVTTEIKNKYCMFNTDAFASGQIDSKLWACRELERLEWTSELTHIYGGWYGVLAFLLLSREQFKVTKIASYDMDPTCESIADMINENWVSKAWQFKAYTVDCNQTVTGAPDLVINTSTEHFSSLAWFDAIAPGTRVVLQGNNMPHDDHVVYSKSLTEFKELYNITDVAYEGSLEFNYPTWSFTRYMIIGTK